MANNTYIFDTSDGSSDDGGNASPYSLRPDFVRHQPSMPRGTPETYADNMELMERVAGSSAFDASRLWAHAVTEGLHTAPPELAARYGLDGLPDWDYKTTTSQKNQNRGGEDAGNFNYGATGYALLSSILRRAGIKQGALLDAGFFVGTWVLRFGGGGQQLYKDFKPVLKRPDDWSRWRKFLTRNDRNWYFEEDRDAELIERGIEYGRYREFAKLARQYGVQLAPENFGFAETTSPYHLLERNLSEQFYPDVPDNEPKAPTAKERPARRESRTEREFDRWRDLAGPRGAADGGDDEGDGFGESVDDDVDDDDDFREPE